MSMSTCVYWRITHSLTLSHTQARTHIFHFIACILSLNHIIRRICDEWDVSIKKKKKQKTKTWEWEKNWHCGPVGHIRARTRLHDYTHASKLASLCVCSGGKSLSLSPFCSSMLVIVLLFPNISSLLYHTWHIGVLLFSLALLFTFAHFFSHSHPLCVCGTAFFCGYNNLIFHTSLMFTSNLVPILFSVLPTTTPLIVMTHFLKETRIRRTTSTIRQQQKGDKKDCPLHTLLERAWSDFVRESVYVCVEIWELKKSK